MSPTVDVEVRRNRHGSVLAYADRDRAARLLADHRAVLQSLYDLVDRRHGSDGETVARLAVREDSRIVDELDLRDRFRRDLEADRAISLVEDLRYHAGERELVTDGGTDLCGDESRFFWTGEECPDCGGDLEQQDEHNVMCLTCEAVFQHLLTETEHVLHTPERDESVRKPRAVTDGGPESEKNWMQSLLGAASQFEEEHDDLEVILEGAIGFHTFYVADGDDPTRGVKTALYSGLNDLLEEVSVDADTVRLNHGAVTPETVRRETMDQITEFTYVPESLAESIGESVEERVRQNLNGEDSR